MAENRTEIAIQTADHIAALLIAESGGDDKRHGAALNIIKLYKSALELTAPPRVGRPRNKSKGTEA